MKTFRRIITIYLAVLLITIAVLFQLSERTDLPMVIVLGRIDGDDGIYRLNPYDDKVVQLFDAGSGHILLPDNRLLVSSYAGTTVINPRNPSATVTFEVPPEASLLSFSPAGDWLLYIDEDATWYINAVRAVPNGHQIVIPLDLSPGVQHLALWERSSHVVLGSTSESSSILHIDLQSGESEKLTRGRLVLPSGDTWSPRIYREQIILTDETGCLTLVSLSDGTEAPIFDKEDCTDFQLVQVGPVWLVYSEQTEDGLTLSRLNLETNQTEEIWSSRKLYAIAYASLDGSLLVLQEEAPSLNLHIFTQEAGLQTINHDLDGPSEILFGNVEFEVFQEDSSSGLGTMYELVRTDREWQVKPYVPDPSNQTPTTQGWIVQPKQGFAWFLVNKKTGKEYPLNANIASHTRFQILEFESNVRMSARQTMIYVMLGLAVLLLTTSRRLRKIWQTKSPPAKEGSFSYRVGTGQAR